MARIIIALLFLSSCSSLKPMYCPEHVEGKVYKCKPI
jgi:hypothetical protein